MGVSAALLACQQRGAFDGPQFQPAQLKAGVGLPRLPTRQRMDARHQFLAVEGRGQVIIRPKAEAFDFVLGIVGP